MTAALRTRTSAFFRAFFVATTGLVAGLLVVPYPALMALEARLPWAGATAAWLDSLTPALDLKHFVAFAAVGFLARLAQGRPRFVRAVVLLVVFAAATELVQYFLESRSARVIDVVSNLAGGLMGYGVAWGMGRVVGRRAG